MIPLALPEHKSTRVIPPPNCSSGRCLCLPVVPISLDSTANDTGPCLSVRIGSAVARRSRRRGPRLPLTHVSVGAALEQLAASSSRPHERAQTVEQRSLDANNSFLQPSCPRFVASIVCLASCAQGACLHVEGVQNVSSCSSFQRGERKREHATQPETDDAQVPVRWQPSTPSADCWGALRHSFDCLPDVSSFLSHDTDAALSEVRCVESRSVRSRSGCVQVECDTEAAGCWKRKSRQSPIVLVLTLDEQKWDCEPAGRTTIQRFQQRNVCNVSVSASKNSLSAHRCGCDSLGTLHLLASPGVR